MKRFLSSILHRRVLALGACLSMLGLNAVAQTNTATWPQRPIKLVVGYAPGGATDLVARTVATRMSDTLGQQMIVDNRTGANSNVAAELVAAAPPDGYTLYVLTVANAINTSLYSNLRYDPLKDFEPIGLMAKIPNILVVNPNVPARTLADYRKLARESGEGLTFASSGSGSSIHLSGELFKIQARLNLLHVPYRGSAPAIADLLGGQVQSMFDNAPSALPHVQGGRLRALAVTSPQRLPQLPDVPTIAESGFPGFDVQSWFSIVAPAGTPKAVIKRLNTELNRALAQPELRQRMQDMAATPISGTPEQLRQFTQAEIIRWREVVQTSGAKPD